MIGSDVMLRLMTPLLFVPASEGDIGRASFLCVQSDSLDWLAALNYLGSGVSRGVCACCCEAV
jgi:hypothetical protein